MIIADHAMFREVLIQMLEPEPDLKVVGQCTSSSEALHSLEGTEVHVALLGIDLGPKRAMDFVTAAKGLGFQGKVLIVSAAFGKLNVRTRAQAVKVALEQYRGQL